MSSYVSTELLYVHTHNIYAHLYKCVYSVSTVRVVHEYTLGVVTMYHLFGVWKGGGQQSSSTSS